MGHFAKESKEHVKKIVSSAAFYLASKYNPVKESKVCFLLRLLPHSAANKVGGGVSQWRQLYGLSPLLRTPPWIGSIWGTAIVAVSIWPGNYLDYVQMVYAPRKK